MEKVAVMDLLSFAPAIETLVSPRFAIVIDETCTCLDQVWSKLMIKEGRIWYFSTWLTIWCKNFSSASYWAPSIGICTFPVVLMRWTKPIHWKRLWAQNFSIFKFSFPRRGYCFSKAFAAAIAINELTTPPLYLGNYILSNLCRLYSMSMSTLSISTISWDNLERMDRFCHPKDKGILSDYLR